MNVYAVINGLIEMESSKCIYPAKNHSVFYYQFENNNDKFYICRYHSILLMRQILKLINSEIKSISNDKDKIADLLEWYSDVGVM
jgi:hypothetical protein